MNSAQCQPVEQKRPGSASARLQGVIRVYTANSGGGFIHADNQDHYFQITDIVGTCLPAEGDAVAFTPQIERGANRARFVVLESDPQYLDFHPPARQRAAAANRAVGARPLSPSQAAFAEQAKAGNYQRCYRCYKIVRPSMRKKRVGLPWKRFSAWVAFCPRCRGRLDKQRQLQTRSVVVIALLIVGVGYGFFA